jgi:hypothetical protein
MATKTVLISSEAAQALSPSNYEDDDRAAPKVGGRTRKAKKGMGRVNVTREGGGTSPGTLDQLASSRVPGTDSSHAVGASSKITEDAAPIGKVAPSIMGGAEVPPEPKVHLAKSQKKHKVILALSKPTKKNKDKEKKRSVKLLKMNLTGFTRKLKKASGIQKTAKEMGLAEIKATLVKMDLVKKDTKAPEDVLRRIYSDVETMKKRAL